MSHRHSKKKKPRKKTSTEDFLSNSTAEPFSFDTASEQILRHMSEMVSKLQNDDVESMFTPLSVTPVVKKQIRRLPVATNQTWVAAIDTEATDDGTLITASVFLVDKEKGSNGLPLGESDGIYMNLAMAADMSIARERTDNFPVLLGAIATACLEPMKKTSFTIPVATGGAQTFPSQRPGRLLLDSSGTMEQLRPSLMEMGITNLDISDAALIQSITCGFSRFDQPGNRIKAIENLVSSTSDRQFREAAAETIRSVGQGNVYVSEKREPMYGWTPPEDSLVPKDWYVCPPPIDRSFRLTELWGWRTNLERAVLQADVEKIQKIVQRRDSDQVREFCECRILLTKIAGKGMLKACQALVELCNVAVDGVRDTPGKWRKIQLEAGDDGTTPLHRAAFEGYLPVVEYLLEKGASVTTVDEKLAGTALLHAVSQGHSDVVRALLEHGSDASYFSPTGGEALDLSEMMEMQGGAHVAAQRHIRQVLREYDPRCSHCRSAGPDIKKCPCQLERYCGRDCQRARWKAGHKKIHKEKMGN
jgi:hypothetical protein